MMRAPTTHSVFTVAGIVCCGVGALIDWRAAGVYVFGLVLMNVADRCFS